MLHLGRSGLINSMNKQTQAFLKKDRQGVSLQKDRQVSFQTN